MTGMNEEQAKVAEVTAAHPSIEDTCAGLSADDVLHGSPEVFERWRQWFVAGGAALDPGIAPAVFVLLYHGIVTSESCQGGRGHAYPEPTVRLRGDRAEGLRALALMIERNWPVSELRRTWCIIEGELTGPYWDLVFARELTSR